MTKQELDNQIVDKKLAELTEQEKSYINQFLSSTDFIIVRKPPHAWLDKLIKLNLMIEKKEHRYAPNPWDGTTVLRSTDREAVLVLTKFGQIVRNKIKYKS